MVLYPNNRNNNFIWRVKVPLMFSDNILSPLRLLAFGAMAAALFMPAQSQAEPTAVVELFTSQGCSSCPPADKILGQLKENDDLIVLSLHIDYWDYLGWKDTFADAKFSARQRDYALGRHDRRVFTPQTVVNGKSYAVGSRGSDVANAIRKSSGVQVPIKLDATSSALKISVAEGERPTEPVTLWMVTYTDEATVEIGRGENTGKSVTYHNVVNAITPIGMWNGDALSVDYPLKEVSNSKVDGCVVLLQVGLGQQGLPGPILGAAQLKTAATN
jgi:hypothetical protein